MLAILNIVQSNSSWLQCRMSNKFAVKITITLNQQQLLLIARHYIYYLTLHWVACHQGLPLVACCWTAGMFITAMLPLADCQQLPPEYCWCCHQCPPVGHYQLVCRGSQSFSEIDSICLELLYFMVDKDYYKLNFLYKKYRFPKVECLLTSLHHNRYKFTMFSKSTFIVQLN